MNVESLIKRIELRPGMYVGEPSLEAIFHFVMDICIIISNQIGQMM